MPLDKGGKFHMNPQHAAMHDASAKEKPMADPGKQDDKDGDQPSHVELHGKEPGPFFTLHHMGDGGDPQRREQPSLHDAHHAMNEHAGADGCGGSGDCEHAASSEDVNDKGGSDMGDMGADDEY